MRLSWPLTGRLQELQAVQAAIDAPDTSGVVVFGAAGVGKSRVVREALSSAANGGRNIHWAVASASAQALPLGALTAWVPPDVTDDLQLVREVIDALTVMPHGSVPIVGIDDGHLLDDLSVFVLQQVVARAAAKIVITVRDGERIPAGLRELWSRGHFERIDLQALSENETAELVSTALDGPLDPAAADLLWKLTRGNPLYLSNIVDHEVAHHRLTLRRGFWAWDGEPTVPPNLVDMVEERIGSLPPAVSDVIDALAVSEPLSLASLTKITGAAAVEEAELRGLIELRPIDDFIEVRVAHPLYGEVRRKRAPFTRLRRLRGIIAAELAAGPDRDDMRTIVRRATLSLESDLEPDAEVLVKAAQGATWLADLALADRLAAAAINAGAGVDAYAIRAHALGWLNHAHEADAVLAGCPTDGIPEAERAMIAFLRANNMLWGLVDPTGAKRFIEEASAGIGNENRGCIDAFLTIYWNTAARPDLAIEQSKTVVLEQLPVIVRDETTSAMVGALGVFGRTDEARTLALAELERLTRSFNAPYMRSIILEMLVAALLLAGRIHEARDIADRQYRQVADLPGHARAVNASVSGRTALYGGRPDIACSLIEPVVGFLIASGSTNDIWYHNQPRLITALALLGKSERAQSVLRELESQPHPTRRFLDYEIALARTWVAAAQGVVSEAVATALAAAATAKKSGQFAVEVLCHQTATQLGGRNSLPRLRELEAVVEGPRVSVAVRFAEALDADDGPGLAAVSKEFEDMGDLVAAIDAAAHAAVTYRRADRKGTALSCSARADELARRCGGVETPALRAASERVPLTAREREIVMLIGQGCSNRAIADRLTLSVRTVEGHIYRAMMKTGAGDRDELARMLPT